MRNWSSTKDSAVEVEDDDGREIPCCQDDNSAFRAISRDDIAFGAECQMHKSGSCSDGMAVSVAGGQVCGLPRPHRAGADLPSE